MFSRRQVMLRPVQVRYIPSDSRTPGERKMELLTYRLLLRLHSDSLQLGLANYLDVPVHLVYEHFEEVGAFTRQLACLTISDTT